MLLVSKFVDLIGANYGCEAAPWRKSSKVTGSGSVKTCEAACFLGERCGIDFVVGDANTTIQSGVEVNLFHYQARGRLKPPS